MNPKSLPPVDRLAYWINERESIRLKRLAGEPPPWTDDPILQRYRFCNVVRIEDKVSQWLLRNWYEPYKNHPNMLLAAALARFINLPAALEEVGFPEVWEPKRIRDILRKRRKRGERVFNGAYIVRGNDGVDKVASVVNHYVGGLVKKPPEADSSSMEKTWAALLPRYGFGSFMAGQVVADLRWAVDGAWEDRKRWAPLGPGSRRGMNRIKERPLNAPISQELFEEELLWLIGTISSGLPRELAWRMEAIDFQNCLCEIDKYNRVLLGEGRPKQLYHGGQP